MAAPAPQHTKLLSGIPDSWPPADTGGSNAFDDGEQRPIVPLFPLSDVWLFPGALMPLFIFEPRYRQMIEDSLDGPGRLVIGTVQKGYESEMPGQPPVYPTAGLGEIQQHERRPDGCFVILLLGLSRVHVEEQASDRLYRRVSVAPLEEQAVSAGESSRLRPRLVEAILDRSEDLLNLPDNVPLANLADLLTLRLSLPHEPMQRIFQEDDVVSRCELVLEEHDRRPKSDG